MKMGRRRTKRMSKAEIKAKHPPGTSQDHINKMKELMDSGMEFGPAHNEAERLGFKATQNPPKSKSAPKGLKIKIPYTPGSTVERNLAIVAWAANQKKTNKSKKFSSNVIAFADEKGNALTFSEILDMQDKAGKKAIPAIMLEDASVKAVFKSNPPISASKDYSDYSKHTADVMVKLLPDVTNLEIENMKATVGSRRAAVELALGKKPSDYTVEGFGTDFVRDDKGQYVPKSLLAYQVLGVRPTRDASMDARFKTQLRKTLSELLGLVNDDEGVEVGLPFIEEQIFITPGHVADFRQMIKLYHELHERNKAYCEKILPGLPSKGFVGGIKAIDAIEALLPSPDALFIGEEAALIVPTDPNLLTGKQTRLAKGQRGLQKLLDIVTGVRTPPPDMEDLASHRKLAAILEREFKGNKKTMATEVCKAVAKAIALYPQGFDAYQTEQIPDEDDTTSEASKTLGKRFSDEILQGKAGSAEYKAALVHIRQPLKTIPKISTQGTNLPGKKTPFAVIQIQTTGFSSPPIGWDRRWMIPLMQIVHEHWEMLETGGKAGGNGLEIHDLLYLTGIRAKDLFDYEINAREWLIILFLLGAFDTGNNVDVKKTLVQTTSAAIMQEYEMMIEALDGAIQGTESAAKTSKETRKSKPKDLSFRKKIKDIFGIAVDNPPRLMKSSIIRNPPAMSILPISSEGVKLAPSYSYMDKSKLLKTGGVDLTELLALQQEIVRTIQQHSSREDAAEKYDELNNSLKELNAQTLKTKKAVQSQLNNLYAGLKRQKRKKEDALTQLQKSKKIVVDLVSKYKQMSASLKLLVDEIHEQGITITEEEKQEIVDGLKKATKFGNNLKSKFTELADEIASEKLAKEQSQQLQEDTAEKLVLAETSIKELEENLKLAAKTRKEVESRLNAQIDAIREAGAEIAVQKNELEKRSAKITERVKAAASGFVADADVMEEHDQVLAAIEELGGQAIDLSNELEGVTKALEKEQLEYKKANAAFLQAEKNAKDARSALADSQKRLEITTEDKKLAEDKIKVAEGEIRDLTIQTAEQSQQIQSLDKLTTKQQKDIGELQNAKVRLTSELSELNSSVDDANKHLNAMVRGGNYDLRVPKDAQLALKEIATRIGAVKKELREVQQQSDDFKDELAALHGVHEAAGAIYNAVVTLNSLHNMQGAELPQEIDAKYENVQMELDALVTELGETMGMPRDKIQQVQQSVSSLAETIDSIYGELDQIVSGSGIVEKLKKEPSKVVLTSNQASDLARLYDKAKKEVGAIRMLLPTSNPPFDAAALRQEMQPEKHHRLPSAKARLNEFAQRVLDPQFTRTITRDPPQATVGNEHFHEATMIAIAFNRGMMFREPRAAAALLARELTKLYKTEIKGTAKSSTFHKEIPYGISYDASMREYRLHQEAVAKGTAKTFTSKVPTTENVFVFEMVNPDNLKSSTRVRDKFSDPFKANPNASHDTQGPFTTQTQARQVAKIMAERGEDVYMWDCPKTGGYMVSLNHPTDIPASKVKKFAASSKPNPSPKTLLPMFSGLPSGVSSTKGVVFSEVMVGRNVLKDVGEGIQMIYRGIIGGRQSMPEKRMAMAIAVMQAELSERAKALGGNAVANVRLDFEQTGTMNVSLIAHADAVKMSKTALTKAKKNPRGEYHKHEDKVIEILIKEGGAAGLKALRPAFPKKTSKAKAASMLEAMKSVVQHKNGDYILITGIMNPSDDDEEWDPSVGAPVKKPKTKKSAKEEKEEKEKEEKRRMASVELGYEFPESQTRQILHGRKMDTEDWKDSLERQGYGTNPKNTRMYKGHSIMKGKHGYRVSGGRVFKRLKDARNFIDATKRGATIHPTMVCIVKPNPQSSQKCGGLLRMQKNPRGKKRHSCMDCGALYENK